MGIMDAFKEEDRATVTVSQLYRMLREAAKTELLMNAVRCDVPNRYIAAMADGKYPEMLVPAAQQPEAHTEDLPIMLVMLVEDDEEELAEEEDNGQNEEETDEE